MSESGTSHLFGGDTADSDPFGGITAPLAKLSIDSSIHDYWDTTERSRFKICLIFIHFSGTCLIDVVGSDKSYLPLIDFI